MGRKAIRLRKHPYWSSVAEVPVTNNSTRPSDKYMEAWSNQRGVFVRQYKELLNNTMWRVCNGLPLWIAQRLKYKILSETIQQVIK